MEQLMEQLKLEMMNTIHDFKWYEILFIVIVTLIILGSAFYYCNRKFEEKNGYPIFYKEYLFLFPGFSIFLRLGTFWRSYAIQHGRSTIYSTILLVFALVGLLLFVFGGFAKSYKKQRKLMWLNASIGLGITILVYWILPILLGIFVIIFVGGILSGGTSSSSKKHSYQKSYWMQEAQDAQARAMAKEIPTIRLNDHDY